MVMINWLKLLAVLEKSSHNFFNLNGDSVRSITLVYSNKSITSQGTNARIQIYEWVGGPILIEDLVGPRFWGTCKPSFIPYLLLKQKCLVKLSFMLDGWLPKSPCFYILPDCVFNLLDMICMQQRGSQHMIELKSFQK